ncbi:MAG: hypothetical protein AAFP68_17695 [Pseudomonadota bacterium]
MAPSIWQIMIVILIGVIWAVPLWKMLPRTGLPKQLALLMFLPVVGTIALVVLIWIMAYRDWPSNEQVEVAK